MSFVRRLPWVGGLVVAAVAGATGLEAVRSGHAQQEATSQRPRPTVVSHVAPAAAELSTAFRDAASAALPGVVRVQVEAPPTTAANRPQIPQQFRGTPFEDLFRNGPMPNIPQEGAGSGFVYREDGYIVTNNHVVDGAARVVVVLPDGREFEARVIGRDPNSDLAVVKIEATGLPVLALGESDPLQVGDWVIALGYPLQLGSTATAGIVSAKGRSLNILATDQAIENFIQTDAAINPGNSGGPLVDLSGRVVGVNTAIATRTGYYSGYGFAIPVDLARSVVEDLIEYGEVHRPRIGVAINDVTPTDAEVYKLPSIEGAEIVEVQPGTPAERAGLQLGDVVVAVNGVSVKTGGDLLERVARLNPGDRVRLDVIRYGEKRKVELELGAFEPTVAAVSGERRANERGVGHLGFDVGPLTSEIARELNIDDDKGVVITGAEQGSPAARAGLGRGLVLERINGTAVASVDDVERVAGTVRPGDPVSVIVRTPDGTRRIVNFRLRG